MRAVLIAILWAANAVGGVCEGSNMEQPTFPPLSAAPDEQSVSDHAGFDQCEAALQTFAAKANAELTDRTYSVSKEWGRILRAKVRMGGAGSSMAPLLICWTAPGPGVQMMVEVPGCPPGQPAC
jgi:hypothetical protein